MKKLIVSYIHDLEMERESKFLFENGIELLCLKTKKGEDIRENIKDADAFVTQYDEVNPKFIDSFENCSLIMKFGTGYDNIDVKYAAQKGIQCCNVPNFCTDEVSNQAIAFILSLARGIGKLDKTMRKGIFSYENAIPFPDFTMSTIGIIGLGTIGKAVVNKLKPFGVKILCYDPFASEEITKELDIEKCDFDYLLSQSDFISIHCPLTNETKHLFNKKAFDHMKKTSYIINTSRGPIIDENALIKALKNKSISGAGLDVFENEPILENHPLLQMDNVLLTPHSGAQSSGASERIRRQVAEEVAGFLNGNPPMNPINTPEKFSTI